jgi:hypothetical protein
MEAWIKNVREDHADLFNLAVEVNKLSQRSLYEINVNNTDLQEILGACLKRNSLMIYYLHKIVI